MVPSWGCHGTEGSCARPRDYRRLDDSKELGCTIKHVAAQPNPTRGPIRGISRRLLSLSFNSFFRHSPYCLSPLPSSLPHNPPASRLLEPDFETLSFAMIWHRYRYQQGSGQSNEGVGRRSVVRSTPRVNRPRPMSRKDRARDLARGIGAGSDQVSPRLAVALRIASLPTSSLLLGWVGSLVLEKRHVSRYQCGRRRDVYLRYFAIRTMYRRVLEPTQKRRKLEIDIPGFGSEFEAASRGGFEVVQTE